MTTTTKTPIQKTNEWLASKRPATGTSSHETRISLALAVVEDIADYAARGDVVLARQARAMLDDLCAWYNDGASYPPAVRERLRERNLRTNPR